MIGDALRRAAGDGHREDVDVAVVLAGEREGRAVGRNSRLGFVASAAGEPRSEASFARDAPQIACVGKNDGGFVQFLPDPP